MVFDEWVSGIFWNETANTFTVGSYCVFGAFSYLTFYICNATTPLEVSDTKVVFCVAIFFMS